MKQRYYSEDPYWLTAKYSGKCAGCGASFARGEQVFRFKNRKVYAASCGCGIYESERFEQLAQDEYLYS